MDQPKSDKFSELSPVLELVYVLLTNMAKYMDVYATDIEADKNEQYLQAKDAIDSAIRKFDSLYGLKSPASSKSSAPEGVVDEFEDDMATEDTPAVTPELASEPAAVPTDSPEREKPNAKPYDFASGNDPESLKKAKQAVEELKTLFADMKKQEIAGAPAASTSAPVPSAPPVTDSTSQAQTPPVGPASTPTFVAPVASAPVDSTLPPVTQAPVQATVPPVAPVATTPETAAPASDANEIDSILAELKKLQNKGSAQL